MTEVLTEVPQNLKLLVRIIMRSFYGDEHAIVMDKLIHHPCIKEDELLELLRFERKQLRAIMTTLKNEKFVRVRMRMEIETDGTNQRAIRHNYYFISYSVLVNVIKYKLDHIRRKIETDERDATSRASFSCPECHKKYTDLEVDQLLDMTTGQLQCSYCQTEVVEEAVSKSAGSDSRSLMVMFNEQIEPIYALLKKVEDIRLSAEILEPEPMEHKIGRLSNSRSDGRNTAGSWSGDANKGVSFGFTESKITISVDGKTVSAVGTKPAKEVPTWISQSTVEGADNIETQPSTSSTSRVASVVDSATTGRELSSASVGGAAVATADSDDIMRTLLSYEKKPTATSSVSAVINTMAVNDQSSSSDSEQETLETSQWTPTLYTNPESTCMDTDEDNDSHTFVVSVGDHKFPVDQVPDEWIAKMTADEKSEYIRLAQEYHEQFLFD